MKKFPVKFKVFLCAIFLLLSFTAGAPKTEAFIVHDIIHTAVDKVFHALNIAASHLTNLSLGLPGTGTAKNAAHLTIDGTCTASKKTLGLVNSADNFGTVAEIAGSAGKIAKISAKIAAVTAIKNCYDAAFTIEKKMLSDPTIQGQGVSVAWVDIHQRQVILLEQELDKLVELKSQAVTELWKGVAWRMLSSAQEKMMTNFTNHLIQKYKINNYQRYADALSTQFYTTDYIQKNYPDQSDQMILRTVLNKQGFAGKTVLPLVKNKTEKDLGFVPDAYPIDSIDFYGSMAQVGSSKSNPFFVQTMMEGLADEAKAQGDQAANMQISQSAGMMARMDCQDVVAKQQSIDQANKSLSADQFANEQALLKVQQNKILFQKDFNADQLKEADVQIKEAQQALDQSKKRLNALPQSNGAFANACNGIQNPGGAIFSFTNSYLASHLNTVNTPKGDNLPFFAGFMESVGKHFLSNLIETGNSKSNIVTEKGVQTVSIAPNTIVSNISEDNQLKTAEQENNNDNVLFNADPTVGGTLDYTFKWDASAVQGFDKVIITGPGNFKKTSTSSADSLTATVPSSGRYFLNILGLDENSKPIILKTVYFDILPNSKLPALTPAQPFDLNKEIEDLNTVIENLPAPSEPEPPLNASTGADTGTGKVQGAFISKVPLHIRGAVGIQPRGPE